MAKGAVAALLVEISADITGLEIGGKRAAKSMDNLGARALDLSRKMAALGAAAAAAGAAMVAGLVKGGIESIDTQAKLARSIDSTIDGLRALQFASGEAGVTSENLASAMQQLNARLGEAQRGTGEAKKALDMLGLSARDLAQQDADTRIATIADRVKDLGLSSAQVADILRDFGIRGGEMVDFLRQGGDAIRAARDDVRAFGLSVSEIDAAKVEAANDAMERIGLTMEGVKNQLAIAFAPILGELANRFNTLAKENEGFSKQAGQAAERIIMGFAKVADVIQGLRVVMKGLELVGVGAWAAIVSGAQLAMEAFTAIHDAWVRVQNAIARGLNALGAQIEEAPLFSEGPFMTDLRQFADEARDRVGAVRSELHELAMQELPSGKVTAFLEDVKVKAQEAAEATAAAMPTRGGTFVSPDESAQAEEDRQQEELDKRREALQARLDQLREFVMSEQELEIARHEERMKQLTEALDAELVTRQEYQELEAKLAEDHANRLKEIREKSLTDLARFQDSNFRNQVKTVSGHLADLTAGVAQHSRALFELNKAAGIANAIVNAYEGISLTMSKYPYPINIGMAAAHAAAAFAQVSAIKSQQFTGGGGAAPSLAGGTPAPPVTPVTGGTPQSAGGGAQLITIEGLSPDSLFSGRAVRELAERLQEHIRDGGTVRFA